MIKKILPVMIGAALVGGMSSGAIADVTAMGHIDTSFSSGKDKNFSNKTLNNLNCTTCSFGFKGSEDLGNGLKAIFKIDFQYDTTERNANGSITDRDQWLGLDSNFGKLRIGTISTVYKSHGAMLDPIYRTYLQGRDWGLQSNLHTGAGDTAAQGRATNTIRYDSPTFAGFQVAGHYTVQKEDQADPNADSPWGIGGHWQAGGFLVFADYITSDAGGDDDAWKVGGRWGFDKFALFGQYEGDGGAISRRTGFGTKDGVVVGQDVVGNGDGADTWFVGGTAGFGNNLIYASYGQADDADGGTLIYDDPTLGTESVGTKSKNWQVVGVHSLSKRTKVYAGYAQRDYDDFDKVSDFSLGMKHTF
jgi:predicted porin